LLWADSHFTIKLYSVYNKEVYELPNIIPNTQKSIYGTLKIGIITFSSNDVLLLLDRGKEGEWISWT